MMEKFVLLLSCCFKIYILCDFWRDFFEIREIDIVKNRRKKVLFFMLSVILLIGSRIPFWNLSFLFRKLAGDLFLYILLVIARQLLRDKDRKLERRLFFLYLAIPISSLGIMLFGYADHAAMESDRGVQLFVVLCFTLMIISNILLFHGFDRYVQSLRANSQQNLLITKQNMDLEYYERLETYNHKYKELIHSTNHYLKTIGELAFNRQDDKILGILEELLVEFEHTETILYSGNPILNAILSERKAYAEKAGILYDTYIEPGFVLDHVSDADIIVMVGNLLDNAITAAQKCEGQKSVSIRMFLQNDKSFSVIKISNDFCEDIIYDNNRLLTTKKEKELHGIGMESIKNKAEKYGGYLETSAELYRFTSILILPIISQT